MAVGTITSLTSITDGKDHIVGLRFLATTGKYSLIIDDTVQTSQLPATSGPGNFHLSPNPRKYRHGDGSFSDYYVDKLWEL